MKVNCCCWKSLYFCSMLRRDSFTSFIVVLCGHSKGRRDLQGGRRIARPQGSETWTEGSSLDPPCTKQIPATLRVRDHFHPSFVEEETGNHTFAQDPQVAGLLLSLIFAHLPSKDMVYHEM
jgi:hypothetical protein